MSVSLSLFSNVDITSSHADGISLLLFLFVCSRASLFLGAGQHVRGERAKELGWDPRPVVLEDYADEGVTSAVATLQ